MLETQINPENNQIRCASSHAPLLVPPAPACVGGAFSARDCGWAGPAEVVGETPTLSCRTAGGVGCGTRLVARDDLAAPSSRPIFPFKKLFLTSVAVADGRPMRRVHIADGWVSLTDTFWEPLLDPC